MAAAWTSRIIAIFAVAPVTMDHGRVKEGRLDTSGPAPWGLTPRTCAHAESPPEVLAKPDAGLIASCRFVPAGRNPDTLRSGRRQHTQSLTRTRFKYPNQEHVGHPAREPI